MARPGAGSTAGDRLPGDLTTPGSGGVAWGKALRFPGLHFLMHVKGVVHFASQGGCENSVRLCILSAFCLAGYTGNDA